MNLTDDSRHLLLVEDDQDDAELAILALRDAGVCATIDVVSDGEDAIEYLFSDATSQRMRTLPSLVLLDVKVPKIDGFEILRRIRADERTRSLLTIMFSSSDAPDDIERSRQFGADRYICKPVEASRYLETVREIGEYWLRVSRVRP